MPRVLRSAVRHPSSGIIATGTSHSRAWMRFAVGSETFGDVWVRMCDRYGLRAMEASEGFELDDGTFADRAEAFAAARDAGQLDRPWSHCGRMADDDETYELISEDLTGGFC